MTFSEFLRMAESNDIAHPETIFDINPFLSREPAPLAFAYDPRHNKLVSKVGQAVQHSALLADILGKNDSLEIAKMKDRAVRGWWFPKTGDLVVYEQWGPRGPTSPPVSVMEALIRMLRIQPAKFFLLSHMM